MTATALFDSMLMRTMASACIIVAVTTASGQWLASARPVDKIVVASQVKPVKQSIEGIRSVLDPSATGSIGRGRAVIIDPCTGDVRR